jgi:hypothetical protein
MRKEAYSCIFCTNSLKCTDSHWHPACEDAILRSGFVWSRRCGVKYWVSALGRVHFVFFCLWTFEGHTSSRLAHMELSGPAPRRFFSDTQHDEKPFPLCADRDKHGQDSPERGSK